MALYGVGDSEEGRVDTRRVSSSDDISDHLRERRVNNAVESQR